MLRILSWLALPFVALAMLVVPLFGGHFCAQEAAPILAGAGALPFIGPLVARWRARKNAHHCCEPGHEAAKEMEESFRRQQAACASFEPPSEKAHTVGGTVGLQRMKPFDPAEHWYQRLPDGVIECQECGYNYTGFATPGTACPRCKWTDQDQVKFERAMNGDRT